MTDLSKSEYEHKQMSNAVAALSMDAVQAANSGHPGMPMGMADAATVLFSKFLKFNPTDPNWADRDRFILSAGHGSMLIYSLLHLTGYKAMTMEQIKNFRQIGSITAGHPEYGHVPGVETTTGPLGQGIANGVGFALAERQMNARYGDDIVDHYTYVIAGDGCLMEGISQEAISLAGHLKLNKLIVMWDDNNITIDGSVELSDTGAHGAPLGDEEIAATRKALGWSHGPFEVPDDVYKMWKRPGRKGRAAQKAWKARLAASNKSNDFNRAVKGELNHGWKEAMQAYKDDLVANPAKLATRASSKNALVVLTEHVSDMVSGSADLEGSNKTKTPATSAEIQADNYDGRYVNYGIREHIMGAAMNGMALHGGIIPYSGTFLVFADYCRPAIRLSALMGVRVIYVMTHDSIGVGEDGPTHQPVEHIASLRAIPNLYVFRHLRIRICAHAEAMSSKQAKEPMILSCSPAVPKSTSRLKRIKRFPSKAYRRVLSLCPVWIYSSTKTKNISAQL